jgi:hypothetical protein
VSEHISLGSARHLIQVEQVDFTGSPHFREDGSGYVPDEGNQPRYVGEPNRAMDHAWALLTFGMNNPSTLLIPFVKFVFIRSLTVSIGRFFLITEEEARDSWGEGYTEYWSPSHGGYVAGYLPQSTVFIANAEQIFLASKCYIRYIVWYVDIESRLIGD